MPEHHLAIDLRCADVETLLEVLDTDETEDLDPEIESLLRSFDERVYH